MLRSLAFLLAALLGLSLGCQTSQESIERAEAAAAPSLREASIAAPQPEADRLLIRQGRQHVEVAELQAAIAALTQQVETRGGHVQSSGVEEERAELDLRIPAPELDGLLEAIAALGEEQSRHVSTRDVTEAVADLDAELTNQLALRDRLRQLAGRAEKVEEILKVERELARVQARVDSLTGRLKRLRDDVAMSTLHVTLTEHEEEKRAIWGPVQIVVRGVGWVLEKLWVIEY